MDGFSFKHDDRCTKIDIHLSGRDGGTVEAYLLNTSRTLISINTDRDEFKHGVYRMVSVSTYLSIEQAAELHRKLGEALAQAKKQEVA